MEITRFIAKGVRGHFDFDIQFKKGVNFLIGDNGSGKTSVLRLIKGMLMPSWEDLADIDYSYLRIELKDASKKYKFVSSKSENNDITLTISYKGEEISDTFPIEHIRKINKFTKRQKSAVTDFIKDNLSALFIGTDRVADRFAIDIDSDSHFIRTTSEYGSRIIFNRMSSNKMPLNIMNSVDIALLEVQERLYYIIRNNAKEQDRLITNFKNSLLSVLFKVFPISVDKKYDFNDELEQLKKNRKRLENIFNERTIGDNFSNSLNDFFDQAEKYLAILNNSQVGAKEYDEAKNNWIANINPNRINEIITMADDYTKSMDKLRQPIEKFVNSANTFFKRSKVVFVDGSGEIIVKFVGEDDKSNSIFELSSGEKQLIILLGHLAFRETNIFVIDEPELSLHIDWQEIFVDELTRVNPNCQYIMATHAPAIIEKREKCHIDLSLKK